MQYIAHDITSYEYCTLLLPSFEVFFLGCFENKIIFLGVGFWMDRGVCVCRCSKKIRHQGQVAGNDDYDYGIKQAGNDDYDYDDEGRCRYADIFFFDSLLKGEEPLDPGGGRVFLSPSIDATLLGLLATRRRLGRRGDSSALRSAFVVV